MSSNERGGVRSSEHSRRIGGSMAMPVATPMALPLMGRYQEHGRLRVTFAILLLKFKSRIVYCSLPSLHLNALYTKESSERKLRDFNEWMGELPVTHSEAG